VILLSGPGDAKHEEDEFEFDCPECGLHIKGEVTKCPRCGVEFVIEEVSEVTCPECGDMISSEATECPKCGAQFEVQSKGQAEAVEEKPEPLPPVEVKETAEKEMVDEEALRQQFPALVAEVKPLLSLANEYEIDASESRRLIDKAVRAGKALDIVSAVQYVKQCRASIKVAIEEKLDREVEYMDKLVSIAKGMGSNPAAVSASITNIKQKRAEGDLEGALREAANGQKVAEKLTGKYIEAHGLAEQLEKLIQSCERFYVDVREARKLLAEAKDAGDHGDWGMMGILSRKGREGILVTLPELLKNELKKAKSELLDAKAEGKDVNMLVKILKEAGSGLKREKYEDALDRLIEFKAEVKHI